MSFHVGDKVRYSGRDKRLWGGLIYTVSKIQHSKAWDNLTLAGVEGEFCEFDFTKVTTG